jgi:1-acyl-sn-glycerol-3-phosphate acyltransferase
MTWQARLLHAVNRVYVRGYHRLEVQTPPTLPARGPAILVCNHISGLDPLLLQAALPRRVVWMMAAEYYDLPVLSWVFRSIEAIPVDRGGRDTTATRAALRTLAAGRILGIFPEGKIAKTHDLLPFQSGVAVMAARTGVPVCPAYLDGTNRGLEMLPAFLKPNETSVRFGPPLQLQAQRGVKPDLNIFTEHIFKSVARLQQQSSYE